MLKYNKYQKCGLKGSFGKTTKLIYGYYGLKFLQNGEVSERQYETIRKIFIFFSLNELDCWFRIGNFWPKTSKSVGVRMGSGKGLVNRFILKCYKGQIFLEVFHPNLSLVKFLFLKMGPKLGIALSLIKKSL